MQAVPRFVQKQFTIRVKSQGTLIFTHTAMIDAIIWTRLDSLN